MLILGLLSIIQSLFLPGFIVLYFLDLHKSILRCLILSAALSLVINYLFVFLLTLLHSYNIIAISIILGIEICLLFLFRNLHKRKYEYFPSSEYGNRLFEKKNSPGNLTLLHYTLIILVFLTVIYYINNVYIGTIIPFSGRDAFASYHQWAINWYLGSLPQHSLLYPQLLSANWSLTHIFISNQYVQSFANCISASFPLLILLTLFDLGLRKKQFSYFIAIPIIGYLLYLTNAPSNNFFTADIPIAFFSMTTIYLLLITNITAKSNEIKKIIILGAVISIGAAFTKKSGFYLALFYPALAWLIALRQNHQHKKILKILIYSYLLILIIVASFYLLRFTALYHHYSLRSLKNILFHVNKLAPSFYQRIIQALTLRYLERFGMILGYFIIPITLIAGMAINKLYRNIFLLFALPFFILWIFFISYDCRNLALILPIVSIIMGFGISFIIQVSQNTIMHFFRTSLKQTDLIITLFILLAYLITMSIQINSGTIIQQQLKKQIGFVGTTVSQTVYSKLSKHPLNSVVMTNSFNLPLLPGLKSQMTINNFTDLNSLKNQLADKKPILVIIYKLLLTQNRAASQGKNTSFINSINDIKNYKTDTYIKNKILSLMPLHYSILSDTSSYMIIQMKQ